MIKSALILMTTFNGEKYISQQIDSIISQTYTNWKLLIRDDGSSDDTINILNDYASKDHRIQILRNTTDKHGAYLNFWTLIHTVREDYSGYDFYFFSDQDDVWIPQKMDVMISKASDFSNEKPLLLYGDMCVIDQNESIVYESINKLMGIGIMSGFSLFFTHGFLWGCDVCINNVLLNTMPLLPLTCSHIDIMSHDNYIGKYALLTGNIKYIDKVLIKHRRHGENTTGGYSMKLSPIKVLKKGIIHFEDLAKIHARVYNQTLVSLSMFDEYATFFPQSDRIRKSISRGGLMLVNTMRTMKVKRKQLTRTLGIYLIALTGIYKKYLYKDCL